MYHSLVAGGIPFYMLQNIIRMPNIVTVVTACLTSSEQYRNWNNFWVQAMRIIESEVPQPASPRSMVTKNGKGLKKTQNSQAEPIRPYSWWLLYLDNIIFPTCRNLQSNLPSTASAFWTSLDNTWIARWLKLDHTRSITSSFNTVTL